MPRKTPTTRRPAKPARANPVALRLLAAQEEERRRIARLLHDDLGQTLTAAVLDLEYARGAPDDLASVVDGVVAELRRLLGDARDLSLSLRPALIDEEGLQAALAALASRLAAVRRTTVDFDWTFDGIALPPLAGLCAFRIAQDALVPLAAAGARLRLRVDRDGSALRIAVQGPAREADPVRTAAIDDRVAAAGGRVARRCRGGVVQLVAHLPLAQRRRRPR